MKLKDMRFRVRKGDQEHIFGWKDIFGYEGEVCGVFAALNSPRYEEIELTYNSGYGFKGINENLEIEVFESKEDDDG